MSKKKIIISTIVTVVLITAVVFAVVYKNDILDLVYSDYKAAQPVLADYAKADDEMIKGDFYVSTKGNDNNTGTEDAPFLTIEKAMEEGIAKGYTRSSKEVADTMLMFAKMSGNPNYWMGEQGQRMLSQMITT